MKESTMKLIYIAQLCKMLREIRKLSNNNSEKMIYVELQFEDESDAKNAATGIRNYSCNAKLPNEWVMEGVVEYDYLNALKRFNSGENVTLTVNENVEFYPERSTLVFYNTRSVPDTLYVMLCQCLDASNNPIKYDRPFYRKTKYLQACQIPVKTSSLLNDRTLEIKGYYPYEVFPLDTIYRFINYMASYEDGEDAW